MIFAILTFGFQKYSVYINVCSHRDAFLKFDIVGPLANLIEDPWMPVVKTCTKHSTGSLNFLQVTILYFIYRKCVSEAFLLTSPLSCPYRSSVHGVYGAGAQTGAEGLRWRREHPCFNSLHIKLLCECERPSCAGEWCDSCPERSALSPLPCHPPGSHICFSGNQVGNMAHNRLDQVNFTRVRDQIRYSCKIKSMHFSPFLS